MADYAVLKDLSEGLLRSAGRTGMSGNLLEVHHPSAPLFDPSFLHTDYDTWGVSISLCRGDADDCGSRVACSTEQLPFLDRAFRVVVLHHLLEEGDEPELEEAVRVLANDGVLLVMGLNRMAWRYRRQGSIRRLPGLHIPSVRTRMTKLGLDLRGIAGAGMMGRNRPLFLSSGLGRFLVPVADLVLLQARHADNPAVTTLKFRKPRRRVVQSAAAQGG